MNTKEKIEGFLAVLQAETNFYVVDVQISPSKIRTKVTVLIDSDSGIGIDECSTVSRKLGAILDTQEHLLPDRYTLEVSSPGADQPLKLLRQYPKNIGRTLKMTLADDTELKGILEACTEESITIRPEIKKKQASIEPQIIAFDSIKKAQVVIVFKEN